MSTITKDSFIRVICERYPYMEKDILEEQYDGSFSSQVCIFRKYTQKAIDGREVIKLKNYFNFIEKNFYNFEDDIQDNLVSSYIGKLDFKCFPVPELFRNMRSALNDYNRSPENNKKLLDFLRQQ